MRIGVVCEGPTDIPAVEHFLGDQLRKCGINPIFRNLFPEPDRTRPEGGWSNLLLWLLNNPAQSRVLRYFSTGLFGGELIQEPLDAIVIQIDADIVDSDSFRTFVVDQQNMELGACLTASERANAMTRVLQAFGQFSDMTNADARRHVVAVAVEATEAWCVAAFRAQPSQVENLRGDDLTGAFMRALEISEGRQPADVYTNRDKSLVRREKFCRAFAAHSQRVADSCPHFLYASNALREVASNP